MPAGDSVAVMIDAGHLLAEFDDVRKRAPNKRIEVEHFRAVADEAVEDEERLFRIYCYHCPPYGKTQSRPFGGGRIDFGRESVARFQMALQDDIRHAARFAYRTGVLQWRGWRCDAARVRSAETPARDLAWRPYFEQKQVDIKIGLDIAWLASKRIVNVIAIVSGDTDFVPAMKFARREGVQVRLIVFRGRRPHNSLVEHSDFVTEVELGDIAKHFPRPKRPRPDDQP